MAFLVISLSGPSSPKSISSPQHSLYSGHCSFGPFAVLAEHVGGFLVCATCVPAHSLLWESAFYPWGLGALEEPRLHLTPLLSSVGCPLQGLNCLAWSVICLNDWKLSPIGHLSLSIPFEKLVSGEVPC